MLYFSELQLTRINMNTWNTISVRQQNKEIFRKYTTLTKQQNNEK